MHFYDLEMQMQPVLITRFHNSSITCFIHDLKSIVILGAWKPSAHFLFPNLKINHPQYGILCYHCLLAQHGTRLTVPIHAQVLWGLIS